MENKIKDITSKERLLLKQIRKRTLMYVGEYSLNKLGDFFEGYREALFNYDLSNQCCIIPKEFNEFVLKKYEQNPSTMGYVRVILQHVSDGKEAIEIFFNLLDEFLEENGFEKIGLWASSVADCEYPLNF